MTIFRLTPHAKVILLDEICDALMNGTTLQHLVEEFEFRAGDHERGSEDWQGEMLCAEFCVENWDSCRDALVACGDLPA